MWFGAVSGMTTQVVSRTFRTFFQIVNVWSLLDKFFNPHEPLEISSKLQGNLVSLPRSFVRSIILAMVT